VDDGSVTGEIFQARHVLVAEGSGVGSGIPEVRTTLEDRIFGKQLVMEVFECRFIDRHGLNHKPKKQPHCLAHGEIAGVEHCHDQVIGLDCERNDTDGPAIVRIKNRNTILAPGSDARVTLGRLFWKRIERHNAGNGVAGIVGTQHAEPGDKCADGFAVGCHCEPQPCGLCF